MPISSFNMVHRSVLFVTVLLAAVACAAAAVKEVKKEYRISKVLEYPKKVAED